MLQFFSRVLFQLICNCHILSALKDLRINNVCNYGLIFTSQIFV